MKYEIGRSNVCDAMDEVDVLSNEEEVYTFGL